MRVTPSRFRATLTTLALTVALGACTSDNRISATPSKAEANPKQGQQLVSGLDLAGMDPSVRPQDDLFVHANGVWLAETSIPADKSAWGSFDILRERALHQLRELIEAESGEKTSGGEAVHNQQMVSRLYRDLLNADDRERADLAVFADDFAAIATLVTSDDVHRKLPALFARLAQLGADTPLALWVAQDRRDSTRYITYLSQGGLGLPDRDYYFDDSEQGTRLREGYVHYLQQLLILSGDSERVEQRVAAVLDLEESLARHHWTRVANRDAEKTYNLTLRDELLTRLGSHWQTFFDHLGLGRLSAEHADTFVVRQPDYIAALAEVLETTRAAVWRDYLSLKLLDAYAPYLGSDYDRAQFAFRGVLLSGTPEQEPRWQRAIHYMNGTLGEALGQLYVERHFPPESRARMEALVDNVMTAFRHAIGELSWMTPTTRERALEKLAAFNTKIGYPNKWRDYSALEIQPNDLIGNIQRIRAWHWQRNLERLGQPVDRDEWFMPPQTVNAYYSPSMNEIVFPAAILQPPFFNPQADDAVNYGAIGAVIGHEIGHGFDDQGSRYDGRGNLDNWWNEQDRERFEALGQRLVEQFSQYQPLPGEFINGELTLGENIGDLGGLGMAYQAYLLSLDGAEPPVIDGYTGQQRVFLGWAQSWRMKRRDELVRQLLKTGPHAQPEFRVNGVVINIDGFHEAFSTRPGDGLYKPEEERIRIW